MKNKCGCCCSRTAVPATVFTVRQTLLLFDFQDERISSACLQALVNGSGDVMLPAATAG
jgi:hypothetical protein